MRVVETSNPEQTESLGAELAAELRPGDLVLVRGELGAGKTTLVRGAARALGVNDPVTSPTFSIGHRYRAPAVMVSHLDLYRLGELEHEDPELLADYLGPGRIAFVEWPPTVRQRAAERPTSRHAQPRRRGSSAHRGAVTTLGFDTSTPSTAVGLRLAAGDVLQARDDPRPGAHPGHTTRLLALAAELLGQAGIGWDGVERIAVGRGPGTFTGLRVGLATARGLAQSLSAELVGVSSLQALAEGAGSDATLAVIDARRGEVFAAAYVADQRGASRELMPARALAPADLRGLLARARALDGRTRGGVARRGRWSRSLSRRSAGGGRGRRAGRRLGSSGQRRWPSAR